MLFNYLFLVILIYFHIKKAKYLDLKMKNILLMYLVALLFFPVLFFNPSLIYPDILFAFSDHYCALSRSFH